MRLEPYIAGWNKPADWIRFRDTLAIAGDAEPWRNALAQYFRPRLDLRYLNPIRLLQEHGTFQGEGFSILAIQCMLIEFLEATVRGISYRFLRHGETLGPYEYASSRDVFVSFLCTRHPFATHFDEAIARDFYVGIRCGLLHEARTKNGWRIWAKSADGAVISREERLVYRDDFQAGLDEFIRWYEGALPTEPTLQEAFIRKFNSLCEA
jgi:hypothetical protein